MAIPAKSATVGGLVVVFAWLYNRYAPDPSVGVRFHYTSSVDTYPVLLSSSSQLTFGLPDEDHKLGIIVEGYTGPALAHWALSLANALLSRDRVGGVIFIDYYHLTTLSRPAMNDNIESIARTIASFFDHLAIKRNFSLSRVHVLCFSMGGRVLGSARLYINTEQKLGRITAMDPSSPWPGYYSNHVTIQRLDDEDAAEVVVLRTSVVSSSITPTSRGFTFNGGLVQAGCHSWYLPQLIIDICSHYRVMALVTEAVLDDDAFPACPCGDVLQFAGCTDPVYFMRDSRVPPGNYCIQTAGAAPFSLTRS